MNKKFEKITTRVTEETKAEIEKLARQENRSVSNYVNLVLEKHLEELRKNSE